MLTIHDFKWPGKINFFAVLSHFSEEEQRAMCAILLLGKKTGTWKVYTAREFAREFGMGLREKFLAFMKKSYVPIEAQKALEELRQKGYIAEESEGRYRVTVPLAARIHRLNLS